MNLSSNTLKISCFLSTLSLLVLLISLGNNMQFVIGYEEVDLVLSYLNEEQTLVVVYGILDFFEGNPFEHQIEIDASQIFPNESLKE